MADRHTLARKAQARETLPRETLPRETLPREAIKGKTLVREARWQGRLAADWMIRAAGTQGGAAAYDGNAFVSLVLSKVIVPFAHFRSIPFGWFAFIVRHYVTSSHFPVYGL